MEEWRPPAVEQTKIDDDQSPRQGENETDTSTEPLLDSDQTVGRYVDPLFLATIVFGLSSWIMVNGVFAELPELVRHVPEGYRIFAWCSGAVALGNIAPLVFLKCFQEKPTSTTDPSEPRTQNVYKRNFTRDWFAVAFILISGIVSCLLLATLWDRTVVVHRNGKENWDFSLPLILAVFLGGMADCLSSVVYWPLISYLDKKYINALVIGETATALLSNVLASIQSVSFGHAPLFSPSTYFFSITGILVLSAIASVFVLRAVARHDIGGTTNAGQVEVPKPSRALTWKYLIRKPFMISQCMISCLENAFLTSIPPLLYREVQHGDVLNAWGVRLSLILACLAVLFSHGKGSYHRKLNLSSVAILCTFIAICSILYKIVDLPLAITGVIAWIFAKIILVYSKMREFQKEQDSHGKHGVSSESFRFGGVAIQIGSIIGSVLFSVPAAIWG